MGNDWFHEYFINELKAIGRKPTSNMQHEVVDSLPSSGNEQTIYFVKNDSSSSNNHYDEYVWISTSNAFEKIGSTQIDGSATQPDWNQNDDTQPDYIKNRPFYTGDPVETVFVEETTIPFEVTEHGLYVGLFETTFLPIVGETYKISWDGSIYESTCVEIHEKLAIGNLSMAGKGSDTGEPFLFIQENSKGLDIGTVDTSASHTISISGVVAPVVKIDEKYLPDAVATKSDVEAAQSTANNAQNTANNAQSTANAAKTAVSAKLQLMQQNTVMTTTTIGTIRYSGSSVPVRGLNIAVGSTIKFTADNNVSGKTVWDRPTKQIEMMNSAGARICLLGLELSHDGETYIFTNKTTSSILSNLVIEYEKVIIPKIAYPARNEGVWLPPYLIANCLYLTKQSTNTSGATLYRITVDNSGTLTAKEVT